jgi:hypothetical protein
MPARFLGDGLKRVARAAEGLAVGEVELLAAVSDFLDMIREQSNSGAPAVLALAGVSRALDHQVSPLPKLRR